MAMFTAYVTSGSFTCEAESQEEAELKYNAYWEGSDCGCDEAYCVCEYDDNDVTHFWEGETV
jgi:hypothetical protein